MSKDITLRPAEQDDIDRLEEIESSCFSSDNLSRRSFQRFIRPGAHELLIAEIQQGATQKLIAYVLVLYRTGTSLARLYSIAVAADYQGLGVAQLLVHAAEQAAREKPCAYMRLEVNVHNAVAIKVYKKLGYQSIDVIKHYYEDGSDALRMEKRIYVGVLSKGSITPYYRQNTEFTCGPAALMMALKNVDPNYQMTRFEELQIWREATTIFMTSGHGGCSPYGLALSAAQRGFEVELFINQAGVPFIDGVRDPRKKAVIELVHEDFLLRLKDTDARTHVSDIRPEQMQNLLRSGHAMIALISTWRLTRNKAPHWVYVAGIDQHFVYINDPDPTDGPWQSEMDYIHVPISIGEFVNMASFGRRKLRALLLLNKPASSLATR